MSINYEWKLTSLKKKSAPKLKDAVIQTFWEKKGIDKDGNEGVFHGATPFSLNDISKENFTKFEDLTQEKVLSWIKPLVVGGYEEHIESQILKQIEENKSPETTVNEGEMPWLSDEEKSSFSPEPAPADQSDTDGD